MFFHKSRVLRAICVVLLLAVLLLSVFANASTTEDCKHQQSIWHEDKYEFTGEFDENIHTYIVTPVFWCRNCKTYYEDLSNSYEDSGLHSCATVDGGHLGRKHYYNYVCECGYNYTEIVSCDGPPCRIWMRLTKTAN